MKAFLTRSKRAAPHRWSKKYIHAAIVLQTFGSHCARQKEKLEKKKYRAKELGA